MSLLPPPLLSSSSISTLDNNNDDILFNSLFGYDNNDDNMTMAPPPPRRKKRAVTANCVGVCESVLGEGCVASVDEGSYTVELRPAGGNVLAAFISLSGPTKGVVHFCQRGDANDVYQEKTFSKLQVLRNILTKHFLPSSSSAGDAFS